jgi:phosphoglucomutase
MINYLKDLYPGKKPSFGFAHDTRHFSRDFAEFCAKICNELGCDAYLFEGPRATPQLSFLIRELSLDAGVVLTASHNPSHDNGFKAYFNDGSQLVEPHATGVINKFNEITSDSYEALPEDQQGKLFIQGSEADRRYMDKLKTMLLQPNLLKGGSTKVVFTNLHGTGGHIAVPMLKELGFDCLTVPEQDGADGRFPTVASPNPENGPALQMAIDLANKVNAEIVIGTDPDCDRMGVAVRNSEGKMELLTGNQIGSLIAFYRTKTFFDQGILNDSNRGRAVIMKTFVTSDLQARIAESFGVSCINTLTGFKWIAAKLAKYEAAIPADKRGNYRNLSVDKARELCLEYSRFLISSSEESYGYLGADWIRDKDGNGGTVMFAEVAAYARSLNLTITDLLDTIYQELGYHREINKSIVMEGAEGAALIQSLNSSYASIPATEFAGVKVSEIKNFAKQEIYDAEGDEIPKEAMILMTLENGNQIAVRASGTEPKIKYYLFGHGPKNPADLKLSKKMVDSGLNDLWSAIEADAQARMA